MKGRTTVVRGPGTDGVGPAGRRSRRRGFAYCRQRQWEAPPPGGPLPVAGPAFSGESRGKSTRGRCPLDPRSGEEVLPPIPPSLVARNLWESGSSWDDWPAALAAEGSKRAAHRLGGWGQIHYPSGEPQIHNLVGWCSDLRAYRDSREQITKKKKEKIVGIEEIE